MIEYHLIAYFARLALLIPLIRSCLLLFHLVQLSKNCLLTLRLHKTLALHQIYLLHLYQPWPRFRLPQSLPLVSESCTDQRPSARVSSFGVVAASNA